MELLEAVDQVAALEKLHEMGCTDGLPVIIPTTELVDRMVLASGLDGDVVLGEVGPSEESPPSRNLQRMR